MEGHALFFLAILIFFSKLVTDFFYRINLPPVLGMILIGLLIGPTGFDLIKNPDDFDKIKFFSDIGVILLLFMAGLETDLQQMRRIGINALLIAVGGVLIPLIGGFATGWFFFHDFNVSVILGVVLTATSVSVSVMTLMDMKKLKTVEGNTIMGAAIIDDVIGIVIMAFAFGILGGEGSGNLVQLGFSLLKIFLFILGAGVFGIFVIPVIFSVVNHFHAQNALLATAVATMFLIAWGAEQAEVAAITGSYLAGVFIAQTSYQKEVDEGIHTIGYSVFISIFFVFIGLQTNLRAGHIDLPFILVLSGVAILGKIFGAGLVAKFLGFNWKRSFRIGSGMVPRGEVALVIATLAMSPAKGRMIQEQHFVAIVFMVILSALSTPFLLRFFFKESVPKIKE